MSRTNPHRQQARRHRSQRRRYPLKSAAEAQAASPPPREAAPLEQPEQPEPERHLAPEPQPPARVPEQREQPQAQAAPRRAELARASERRQARSTQRLPA